MANKKAIDSGNDEPKQRSLVAKYRPRRLRDLLASEAVIAELRTIVSKKEAPTAICLTGPSGTGKTTTARMIATYFNCETRNSCGKCQSCKLMAHSPPIHNDYMEVNASAQRGIDDIRNIINTLTYSPNFNIRVVCMDEIQGATPQAQEACLKPLEEPPRRTLFILATTNPEKIRPAVLGRCRRIRLSHISPEMIASRLRYIAQKERASFVTEDQKPGKEEARLFKTLAEISNGQMRDAVELLESTIDIAKAGGKVDVKTMISQYIQTHDIAVDKVAANIIYCLLSRSLKNAVDSVYAQEENARGVMHKMRWTIDRLLRESLGRPVGFKDIAYRELKSAITSKGLKFSIADIVHIQSAIVSCEARFNSLSAPEHTILIQTIIDLLHGPLARKE